MGRKSYSNREVLENSAEISISDLLDIGLLKDNYCLASWKHNITSSRQGIIAEVETSVCFGGPEREQSLNYIQFDYRYSGKNFRVRHPIEIVKGTFGGHVYYFTCSCYKNDVYCGARMKKLYFGGHVWACRHCLELVYQNCRYKGDVVQNLYNAEKWEKKAEKLKRANHPKKAKKAMEKANVYREKHEIVFSLEARRRFGL